MLVLVIALVLAPLAWLAIKRLRDADPAVRGASVKWVIACLAAALALRVGLAAPLPLRIALGLLAVGSLAVWLRRRGHGGDGPDDGRNPPADPDPGPDPGHREPRPERLDPEAFDRARAEWEQGLKDRAPD